MESKINRKNILVLGAGHFGTCLAQHLASLGHKITIWEINQDVVNGINQNHRNPRYLKDIELSEDIEATSQPSDEILSSLDACVLAIPTQFLRKTLESIIKGKIKDNVLIVCAAKGIELETFKLPLDIVKDVLGEATTNQLSIISGPSFAVEVAQHIPTAVATASMNAKCATSTQNLFHSPYFRVYTSEDPVGLEVAGALKNIIAIASGACLGLGFQNNSRAALITRGLAEITRVGKAMGANPLTFMGLGGVGDLFLTCSSEKSRNFSVGYHLGQGLTLDETLEKVGSVAEGVATTKAAYNLTKKLKVETPIIDAVYDVLYNNKPIKEVVHGLLHREATAEGK